MKSNNKKTNWFTALKNKLFKVKDERTELLEHLRTAQRKCVINLDALMMI